MVAILATQAIIHVGGNDLNPQHQNIDRPGELRQLQTQAGNGLIVPKNRLFLFAQFPLTEAGGTEGNGQQRPRGCRDGGHAQEAKQQPEPTEAIGPRLGLRRLGARHIGSVGLGMSIGQG